MKKELLNSLWEKDEVKEPGLDDTANNKKDPEEDTAMTKWQEEIINTHNKEVTNIVGKQGQLFKKIQRHRTRL